MEKYITDERTGLKYELVGDYYLIAGDDEPEQEPIGIWGQRHLRYLREHHRVRYANLLTNGKMNAYLADIDRQAEELFLRLAKHRPKRRRRKAHTTGICTDQSGRLPPQSLPAVL